MGGNATLSVGTMGLNIPDSLCQTGLEGMVLGFDIGGQISFIK